MFAKKELATEVLNGIDINEGEKKVDYEARVFRTLKEQTEKQTKEAEISSYNNLKSICLSCKNSFIESYIENPHKPDPTNVICKRKVEIMGSKAYGMYFSFFAQQESDKWHRKTLSCSDYEERK